MLRYAIYFVPQAESALYRFGSSVLGYDSVTGEEVAAPDHPFFGTEAARGLASEPRRYGFHATLKAPFALATGQSEAALLRHAEAVCSGLGPVSLGRLQLAELGSFLALRPMVHSVAALRLAEHCVTAFESFRAPLSAVDRDRRLRAPLTPRQVTHLDRWGYPYVFEDFRFHMTLTGPLSDQQRQPALGALRELFARSDETVVIDAVTIMRQANRNARFVVIERAALSGRSGPS